MAYLYQGSEKIQPYAFSLISKFLEKKKIKNEEIKSINKELKEKTIILKSYILLPFFTLDVFSIYISKKIIKEKENILTKSLIFSIWLKLADSIVEKNPKKAEILLRFFQNYDSLEELKLIKEDSLTLYYFTILLSELMKNNTKKLLEKLYSLAIEEIKTKNYLKYLKIKADIGVYSFLIVYSLVKDEFKKVNLHNKKVLKLFALFGALANLYDFLVDFEEERIKDSTILRNKHLQFLLLVLTISIYLLTLLIFYKKILFNKKGIKYIFYGLKKFYNYEKKMKKIKVSHFND